MKIGVGIGEYSGAPVAPAALAEQAEATERMGLSSVWLPQIFGVDAMTVLAVAAQNTKTIELGTAVVPIQTRHPVTMAQQALTLQAACSGRFRLGIGLSHKPVVEGMLGVDFQRPATRMREYLTVLGALIRGGSCSFRGSFYTVNASVAVPGSSPVPILVAALADKMLRIAGELADGTITWMTGRKTLETHIVPKITAAAAEANKPRPQVVVGLPVALTSDVNGARERATRAFAIYPTLPSYRAMLDIEGASSAADILVAGDESEVEAQLRSYIDAGATEILAVPLATGDTKEEKAASVERTREFLGSLATR